ncbi:phage tail tip lysozyme, partial [Weissella minor]
KQTTPVKPVQQQKQVKPAPKKQTTPVKPVQQKQVKPAANQVVLASLAKPVQQEQVKSADFQAEQVQATAVKPVDSKVQTSTTPKFMKVNATVASQPEVVTNEAADFNTVNQAAVQTSALPLNSSISYSYTDQQIANAQFIYNYFLSLGWTPNAIAGLLANMMAASYLNPVFTDGVGYGLLQWTSTDDLIAWTQAKGYDYQTLSGQCAYIQHMMTTKVTSFENENEKMSSVDYTESKQSPAELAVIFRNNYDGLKSTDDAQLSADADYWYQLFAI